MAQESIRGRAGLLVPHDNPACESLEWIAMTAGHEADWLHSVQMASSKACTAGLHVIRLLHLHLFLSVIFAKMHLACLSCTHIGLQQMVGSAAIFPLTETRCV